VQDLGIYTSQLIDEYYGSQMFELPPHLYAVANEAYYQMKEETSDQCTFLCLFCFVLFVCPRAFCSGLDLLYVVFLFCVCLFVCELSLSFVVL